MRKNFRKLAENEQWELQISGWVVIGAVVIGYMGYKQLIKVQSINPAKLWSVPLILAIWNVVNLEHRWNDSVTGAAMVGALGLETAIGLVRGSNNRVSVDRESNGLIVFGSLTGMLVWLAGLALSSGMSWSFTTRCSVRLFPGDGALCFYRVASGLANQVQPFTSRHPYLLNFHDLIKIKGRRFQ